MSGYEGIRGRLLELLQATADPPEPPPGSRGSVHTFRAAPNFLKYRLVLWGFAFGAGLMFEVVMVVSGLATEEWGAAFIGWALLVLTVVVAIVKYFLIRLDYDLRYYVVTDRSLRIREGALIIHEGTYTFANIQNVKIHQGPLERLLGIANLVVETAGGAGPSSDKRQKNPFSHGHEGNLRGITNAMDVRDQILRLLKRYRDAGLGDPEDHRATHPVRRPAASAPSPLVLQRLREIRDEVARLEGSELE